MAKADPIAALSLVFVGDIVEAFLRKHEDWSATRLGTVAVKDPGKVGRMRQGVQPRTETARKILATIEKAAPGFAADFVKRKVGVANA